MTKSCCIVDTPTTKIWATLVDNGEVWIHLQPGDPTKEHESFIIGLGDTRAEAIIDAVNSLKLAAKGLGRADFGSDEEFVL